MGKIILFEEKNFQGRSYECLNDCTELTSVLSRCQSCRVENGCFMVYERSNFMGNQLFLKRGEYHDLQRMMTMGVTLDSIRSCRLIPAHRGQFKIKIFERENMSGQSNELQEDCENIMERFRMNDILSCQVMEGQWLLFEQAHFRGRMIYVKPGEHRSLREMGQSNMRIMSLRRITDMC
ncbi:gamma-crystallin M1-like isoform X2 [Syngnathus acus]|uniref:gamma-crystallin M1-like isoform X1 n=1 Tax=Syngnathus acus TaxID=161584 RepID=UPI001885D322|nr:gamma-crystallin M1-like isoform X1 [Syngnathus acus]XP_037095986.1 gamma-crystallin M1-like isoform X2 [Syngnathus acus]